jgi:hypothetical protein
MNDQIAKKVKAAIDRVAADRGEIDLAALVQREGTPPDMWDLVVVAPWATGNRRQVLEQFFRELRRSLTKANLLEIARIVLLDRVPDGPLVPFVRIGDDLARASRPGRFLGVEAHDAYFLVSNGALQHS